MVSPQRLPAPAIPSLEHWNTDALHILLHASACITICQIGNGAFTELVVEKCAPTEVQGIDPSEGQLKYARARPATRKAEFRQGDAKHRPTPRISYSAFPQTCGALFTKTNTLAHRVAHLIVNGADPRGQPPNVALEVSGTVSATRC